MVTMNEALAIATKVHQKAFFDRANLTDNGKETLHMFKNDCMYRNMCC